MKVRELISQAFYYSGIVARSFETVGGQELSDGLTLLNFILSDRNSDGRFLPYYDRQQFNAIIGQEYYFIPNMVEMETMTVTLDNVRFPMRWITRDVYWGTGRVNNIESLPFCYYNERQIRSDNQDDPPGPGMGVWSYWLANQTDYVFEVVGRFSLAAVTADTVISDKLEGFYIDYLIFKLAQRICLFYNQPFGQDKMAELEALTLKVDDVNPIDTTLQISNPFDSPWAYSWGDVNFGHGWRPGT